MKVFSDYQLEQIRQRRSLVAYLDALGVDLQALLARLDAAERVCVWDRLKGYKAFLSLKASWCKVAGK